MTTEPQTVNQPILQPKEILCKECGLIVATDSFERHEQIHKIAKSFTPNELLANISATLTEIKSDLEELKRAKAYELARIRSR